jgi:hypothetical protein
MTDLLSTGDLQSLSVTQYIRVSASTRFKTLVADINLNLERTAVPALQTTTLYFGLRNKFRLAP